MLEARLLRPELPIGRFGTSLHVYRSIGSTNERAAALASEGAPEGSLVVAGEQTAGRGRQGRHWDTPAGAGLAVSAVLRPPADRAPALGLLGGLAVVEAAKELSLNAQLKWPNDVLLGGQKVAGVLPEAKWSGSELEHVVLGIGVNLRPIPGWDRSSYEQPATSLEEHLHGRIDSNQLLLGLLRGLEHWYQLHLRGAAHPSWEQHLAFYDEPVEVQAEGGTAAHGAAVPRGTGSAAAQWIRGRLLGLSPQGGLRLELAEGSQTELSAGRLRPGTPDRRLA